MSNTIREYRPIQTFSDAQPMSVTSTMQGEHGHGVQFTIGSQYIVLAQNQVKDLVSALKKRLNCTKGYAATDNDEPKTVYPEKVKNAN